MIEQNVRAVRCRDQRIWVHLGSQTGCPVCDDGNGSGAGVFSKLLQTVVCNPSVTPNMYGGGIPGPEQD